MKTLKKIGKLLLLLFVIITISSCEINQNTNNVRLPRLDNLTREEIKTKLESLGLKCSFKFTQRIYYDESEYDQFVQYGNGLKAGSVVGKGDRVLVYTTVLPLPSENVVDLEFDLDYVGKNFIEDGIEEVTLARCVDGDTAHFYLHDGTYVKIRFLGIDTPESTMEEDPWGLAASRFTKQILQNASSIVLEAEGNRKDIYGRYLAFVWADGVLVNLSVVQNAYSNSKLSSSSKYYDAFYDTELVIGQTGRRVWGEVDPEYDYENGCFK